MTIRLDVDGAVATVTMDRPEAKNALGKEARQGLVDVFTRIQDDADIRAVVLMGGGNDFCSGADVREMGGGGIPDAMLRVQLLHRMVRGVIQTGVPVIAAVRGVCIGVGWSMALACDYVIAAPDSRFQFAFRHIGLAPDGGAVHLLTRNLGVLQAKALIYSGRFVSGEEAYDLGLASELAPAGEVIERAHVLAAELATAPTLALRMAKRQFNAAEAQTYDEAIADEVLMQPLMVRSEDFKEGTTAFKEKRKPSYKGF